MAKPRNLAHPPIQEATIQFEFGGVEIARGELDAVASVYEAERWTRAEAHVVQATISGVTTDSPSASAAGNFLGYILTSPSGVDLVHIRASLVAASRRKYSSWEDLMAIAKQAFERYVDAVKPERVTKVSTRFINRIPPNSKFKSFDAVLMRPPLPIEGLPEAATTDFLRRHVLQDKDRGFVANLTIGTVVKDSGEEGPEPALVIDSDVFKVCDVVPKFEALESELTKLRSIKNALFFGSVRDAVVEEFT